MQGRCSCGAVRYRLTDRPLIVHCCHCSWCQRESGSAFAVNAMIEADRLQVEDAVEEAALPSASGKGQIVARCAACGVTLYGHYAGSGRRTAFVRVGTLDDPSGCPPDVHIFTSTRLPWVALPPGVPAFPEYYRASEVWRPEALARREALRAASG